MISVFIDGQAGTTGLEIVQRLAARDDVELLEIDPAERKSPQARQRLFESADVAILCLPDDAAREAAALADDRCRVIDASTAHRIREGWCYGLPELGSKQRQALAAAERVANPGCYPQGFILMIRPLIQAGLLDPQQPLAVQALSGYSGGGRTLIEARRAFGADEAERRNTEPYALSLRHKHVPEMRAYSGTEVAPLFSPSVGHFYQGMLVQVPLFCSQLRKGADYDGVYRILMETYALEPFIDVLEPQAETALTDGFLNATACNGTNRLQIMLFGHDEQMLLMARYDNLGKGAAGAAVQNLNLMMGIDETTGLAS
jgi:N-acetyl-gamma-glutamyl-phosphate reductase